MLTDPKGSTEKVSQAVNRKDPKVILPCPSGNRAPDDNTGAEEDDPAFFPLSWQGARLSILPSSGLRKDPLPPRTHDDVPFSPLFPTKEQPPLGP